MAFLAIPFYRRGDEKAEPLRRCIEASARGLPASEFDAAIILAYFFEAFCEKLIDGHRIVIPGLGAFKRQDRKSAEGRKVGYTYVHFTPARIFRKLVGLSCLPDRIGDAMAKYARRHHPTSRWDKRKSTPATTLRALRDRVEAQARQCGYPLRVDTEGRPTAW